MYNFVKLKTLFVGFQEPLNSYYLPAFRAAVAEKAGKNHILFHNHISDNKYLYSYPKIQYKIIRGRPAILCLNEGIDEIHYFFRKASWDLNLNERYYKVKIKKLSINQYNMQVWDTVFRYSIINWRALNQENYELYKSLIDEEEKQELLEKILIGNILSFAKGINWTIEKDIKLKIERIHKIKTLLVKKVKTICFDVDFITNVFLPNYIGLGKNVTFGFGLVQQKRKGVYESEK